MTYQPDPKRYDAMLYRNCGKSGLKLPAMSLALWHNFGEHLRRDFRPYRDELIISSKAGYEMWPGPTARAEVHANTCWPAWTRACSAWALTMWTFFARTASIPTLRLRTAVDLNEALQSFEYSW